MELTIALCISPDSKDNDIVDTLFSIPTESGIDLVIYSEDTKRVKQIIKEDDDLETYLVNGSQEMLLCEEPYSSDDTYMNIGVEDCKTDLITFLKPGDIIGYFDSSLLLEKFDVGFGSLDCDNLDSIASTCYESRMLPLGYHGTIFSVDFLRKNKLKIGDTFIPKLINLLISDLENPDFIEGWGKYNIDELYSVYTPNLINLKSELRLPKIYKDLWKNHEVSYNFYLRDLLWNRMSRAAGILITSYPDKKSVISEFYEYLLPEKKVSILC